MTAAPERLQLFRSINDRLALGGRHLRPQWWDAQAERGYLHPTARRSIFQVGRGGDKSTMGLAFAETEMLSRWRIPYPERHYFAWVSENVEEAAQRPRQVEADFQTLGIRCTRAGNTVELDDLPIGFKAFPCRVGAVSGFRCIGFVADEEAKWRSADEGANPAREVIASLRAMTVTHADAREWHLSSPLAVLDYHYEQFSEGDNDVQIVANAPSWIANSEAITEEQTRALERDRRIWLREYAAIPQAAALAAFPPESIDRAFGQQPPYDRTGRQVLVMDASSGRKDTWSWAIVSWVRERIDLPPHAISDQILISDPVYIDGLPYASHRYVQGPWKAQNKDGSWREFDTSRQRTFMVVDSIGGQEGRFFDQLGADQVVKRIAHVAHQHGISEVHGDQREGYALKALFMQERLMLHQHDWTGGENGLKSRMVAALRRRLAEGTIFLPKHDRLRSELYAFEEKITPSGGLTFGARGSGHDDYVSCVLTAQAVDIENPNGPNHRHVVSGR